MKQNYCGSYPTQEKVHIVQTGQTGQPSRGFAYSEALGIHVLEMGNHNEWCKSNISANIKDCHFKNINILHSNRSI
jgi:hypothetical protein